MAENRYVSIVVGAGMAGLSAATYLARSGQSVLLIEKNKEPGGLVGTFSRDGFYFEAGIRALENAGIIFPMLKELGISLDVVKSHVSVGVGEDIIHVEGIESLDAYRRQLVRIFPESREEIDHLLRIIRKIMKHMDVLYGIENPNFIDLKSDRSFLFKKLLPWLPKFIFTIGKINRMNMPVEEYLEQIITNPSLRDIISQHFFKNTPAFFALSYFSLYLDYFYPRGGVGKLPEALERKYLEFGGAIAYETRVSQVSAKEQTITDQTGIRYAYDHLVWAADLKTLYRIMDTRGLPGKIKANVDARKSLLQGKRGGDSVYTLYLEVDEPAESFQRIANGHFFYSSSKEGLGDTHRGALNEIIQSKDDPVKASVLQWLDNYISLNTFEISIPVLKDPRMAPEGKSGVIVSILTEYDLFKRIADAGWYTEFVEEIEKRIISVLAGSVYPFLKDKLMAHFSFTPLSYANRVGSSEGAITGWSFQEAVPAIHKIQQANRAVLTPMPSVLQAGQWTYSPAGVPMSILTGKLAARKIINN